MHRALPLLLLLLSAAGVGRSALAGGSHDSCSGFIDSLPAAITSAGTWCLRQDLSTSATSGAAITIQADNVVLDCHGFKLGGLGAGTSTNATGILGGGTLGSGGSQYNVTVRNCNVRGFATGLSIVPGSGNGGGYLVEDNLFDQNRVTGIIVGASRNRVQRNRVLNTGGRPGSQFSAGIRASADLVDNTVDNVFADAAVGNTSVYGIELGGRGFVAEGNHVSGLLPTGTGAAFGLLAGSATTLRGNRVVAPLADTAGIGICGLANGCACLGNTVANFDIPMSGCTDLGGNASH